MCLQTTDRSNSRRIVECSGYYTDGEIVVADPVAFAVVVVSLPSHFFERHGRLRRLQKHFGS